MGVVGLNKQFQYWFSSYSVFSVAYQEVVTDPGNDCDEFICQAWLLYEFMDK